MVKNLLPTQPKKHNSHLKWNVKVYSGAILNDIAWEHRFNLTLTSMFQHGGSFMKSYSFTE